MKIAIAYRRVTLSQPVETLVERHVHKIDSLLKSYEPDLVQLRGVLEANRHGPEFSFDLNLSLPTGQLHASAAAEDVRSCAKKALVELETQVKKHQALLRKHFEWKHERLGT
jgi:ribosomal subunit interface protein